MPRWLEVLSVFFRLGLTSFGGPVAHLAYFRTEFVERRRWLSEAEYGDLIALCQFLPGPASSQTGMAIGRLRAGLPGLICAFIGFTLPSAVLMIGFAFAAPVLSARVGGGWLHGMQLAAIAVVIQAIGAMAAALAPDLARKAIVLSAAIAAWCAPSPAIQVACIVGGAAAGFLLPAPSAAETEPTPLGRRAVLGSVIAASAFAALLFTLPLLRSFSPAMALADGFYRSGALVFGGGHVVLPLLDAAVVRPGWISHDAFLAGYGAAQAVPGPLFTFAGYLGAAMSYGPGGVAGGVLALGAIFLPSALLIIGLGPWWTKLRASPLLRRALPGANAAVIGLLVAVVLSPLTLQSVRGPADTIAVLVAAGVLLKGWAPPWLLVLAFAGLGALIA